LNQTYFELFGIPEQCIIDEDVLRKSYYKLSRSYHPDFYTLSSEDEQNKAARTAELVNDAYKTLSDKELRIKYILTINGFLVEGDKSDIDNEFLMEMMEINEAIFELKTLDPSDSSFNTVKLQVQKSIDDFELELSRIGEAAMFDFDKQIDKPKALKRIKEYYLKHRYLLRMMHHLNDQSVSF
jgi:molecular chaperone HscB